MSKVFIEETTLTAIGDALRRKHGETKEITVTETVTVPSTQIIKCSEDSTIDDCGKVDEIGAKLFVVDFTGANAISVYFTVNATGGGIVIYKGRHTEETIGTAEKLMGTSKATKFTQVLNADVVTVRCETIKTIQGYYIELSALDENGNVISGDIEKEVVKEVVNTYNPLDMPIAIDEIKAGADIPEEAFNITGDCSYRFAFGGWNWFLDEYGDKITTKDITNANNMFSNNKELISIPFDLNFDNSNYYDCGNIFVSCNKLTEIGKLKNIYPNTMASMFSGCSNLRYLPEFENLNLDRINTYASANMSSMFSNCYSLKEIPEDFLKMLSSPKATTYVYAFPYSAFYNCYVLDEIKGLNPQTGNMTSNMFSSTFMNCSRVKDIIFALQEDDTPYKVNWKTQTMDLSKNVGYGLSSNIYNNNSGITADKQVNDDVTYQTLKNDADWFTVNVAYSRYNKVSAVNTINSLPDTSAYLATAGGTNTIKFTGASGSLTDGGAINTMTEEEIAVATAKGWTVTFV